MDENQSPYRSRTDSSASMMSTSGRRPFHADVAASGSTLAIVRPADGNPPSDRSIRRAAGRWRTVRDIPFATVNPAEAGDHPIPGSCWFEHPVWDRGAIMMRFDWPRARFGTEEPSARYIEQKTQDVGK